MFKRIYFALTLVVLSMQLNAQMSNTLYFMDRIPQFGQLNPASQPRCDLYIGMPAASSLLMTFGNNSLNLGDIYSYNKELDSVISILHPKADTAKFFGSLKDQNSLFTDFRFDILSFGFRVKSWYFTFNTSLKSDFSVSYPKDFAKLMLTGLKVGTNADLKGFGLNTTTYGELALGASKIINDDYTVGAKAKFLLGVLDVSTDNSKFSLTNTSTTDGLYLLKLTSGVQINGYLPYLDVPSDTGKLRTDSIFKAKKSFSFKPSNSLGFATDLGVIYNGISKVKLSASIIDLGFISWKNDVYNFKMNGNFEYKGVNIDFDSLNNAFSKMTDSVTNAFSFYQKRSSYTTMLPLKICIAGEYFPEDYFSLGLLSLSQFYKGEYYQQIMTSANVRFLKMWMLSASYSFFDNGFSNMGIGMSYKFGPLQYYFISDNIPMRFGRKGSLPIPYKFENLNLRFGFNFVFGCTPNRKANKDKPLGFE